MLMFKGGWVREGLVKLNKTILGSLLAGILVLGAAQAAPGAVHCGKLLDGKPEPAVVSSTIGKLIRGLILIQASFAALGGGYGLLAAAVLLLLWPVAAILCKRFYAS